MEPTTGLILRRITKTELSVSAHKLATVILEAIVWQAGTISRDRFEQHIRELAAGNPMLEAATEPMVCAHSALRRELAGIERHVRQLAQADTVCRRLMPMPGVGAVAALTY